MDGLRRQPPRSHGRRMQRYPGGYPARAASDGIANDCNPNAVPQAESISGSKPYANPDVEFRRVWNGSGARERRAALRVGPGVVYDGGAFGRRRRLQRFLDGRVRTFGFPADRHAGRRRTIRQRGRARYGRQHLRRKLPDRRHGPSSGISTERRLLGTGCHTRGLEHRPSISSERRRRLRRLHLCRERGSHVHLQPAVRRRGLPLQYDRDVCADLEWDE